ncbi:MAG: hypothetical protein GXP37_11230 [Chloroflexi bacterium]|nr:hypothetical protein [Chloroflexota bacterium]
MNRRFFLPGLILLIVFSLLLSACGRKQAPTPTASPIAPTATPLPTPEPTVVAVAVVPTLPPLPPRVVAMHPARGEELSPQQPIEIIFDQPVDADSLSLAFEPELPGKLRVSGNTVRYTPAAYQRGKRYLLQLSAASQGLQTGPLRFHIQTQGYLQVTATTPSDGAEGIAIDAPISIAFNRPVVPLGIAGDDPSLPQPLNLEPVVSGSGRWLNPSIYLFQPDGPLAGGITYTATIADLNDLSGSPLEQPTVFQFRTAVPVVTGIAPVGDLISPNTPITITFSQEMAPARSAGAVQVVAGDEVVTGEISWHENGQQLVFMPEAPLPMGAQVLVSISTQAQGISGAPLPKSRTQLFRIAPLPAILFTDPKDGVDNVEVNGPVLIRFTAPVLEETLQFDVSPPISATEVYSWYSSYDQSLSIYFPRQPRTAYTVTLAGGISDPYGHVISDPTTIHFRTGDLPPFLSMLTPGTIGLFDAYNEPAIRFNHVNITDIDIALYRLPAQQFATNRPDEDYSAWRTYRPPKSQLVRSWILHQDLSLNQVSQTRAALTDASGAPLGPGFYFITARSPQVSYGEYDTTPRALLVISRYNVVIKKGVTNALVWVTDLQSGQPVAGQPVTIYHAGEIIASGGTTNAEGVYQTGISASDSPWQETIAFVGTEDDPGWTSTRWDQGISVWNFDLPGEYYTQDYRVHLLTERPLYSAGDTVHARAIIRRDDPAGYALPPSLAATFILRNPQGDVVEKKTLTADAFGAVAADFTLSSETELGSYSIQLTIADQSTAYVGFLVAAFRKPEYELSVSVAPAEVLAGETATAAVQASYFSGGPVKRAQARWTLFSAPYTFPYDDGHPWSFTDFQPDAFFRPFSQPYRQEIGSGEGQTDDQGQFSFDVPTELSAEATPLHESAVRTIEFSVTDVNDQEISGSTALIIHAAGIYPGVRPDRYVGMTQTEQIAHFIAVDALSKAPLAAQTMAVNISLIDWRTVRQRGDNGRMRYTSTVDETPVVTTTVTTGADGTATLAWTPEQPGQYLIRTTAGDALGNSKRSAAFAWISGTSYAPWRISNDDRIELIADRDTYQVGDTAQILIPSPFAGPTTALVTIEQRNIISHRLVILQSNSETLEVPILGTYAPDVFVSVLLVQPPTADEPPGFKLGLVQINVDVSQHLLNLSLSAEPNPARPGDTVSYTIRATDYSGRPVSSQISLALVDKALLSLRPDETPGIAQTFWSQRGLGVQTGVSLVASLNRIDEAQSKGAKGGGGGGFARLADIDVRSDFRDIAFWQADVETNSQGEATVQVTLPDNLTTWQMRAIGVTRNTIVGEATYDLLVTKPLLVRPVLPRFVVHGDHFLLGAIVQNNTGQDQRVALSIELDGLSTQDDPTFQLDIPAGELSRVDLPVEVNDIDPSSSLVRQTVGVRIVARANDVNDAIELSLPVRRYSSPETVATAGVVSADETRYEAISLPDRYDPTQGEFTLRLEPSLAAGMTEGLRYLKHFEYECTEQTVSRFLPNILTTRALGALGLSRPDLAAGLATQVNVGLQRLLTRQNPDGGWGWFAQEESNLYTSAYVLFGLAAAQGIGYTVDSGVIQRGADFLRQQLRNPDDLQDYELNRQAFIVYVLDEVSRSNNGARPLADAQLLVGARQRLALYAQAYLALTLQAQSDVAATASQAQDVLDNLLGQAIVSATGAHWEEANSDWWTMNTDTRSTAVILAALVAIQPDHPLGPNVVRWLMHARTDGHWQSTHETAWTLIALTDWMAATGELQADYDWDALFNGQPLANGHISPADVQTPYTLRIAIADLLADQLNLLQIDRGAGPGQLYYSADLRVYLPVPDLQPLSRGITVARRYFLANDETGTNITAAHVGDIIDVELTLIIPSQMHYFLLEDPIPAGAEPIDSSLATTSQRYSGPSLDTVGETAPAWWRWWWYPTSFELKDDKVALFATSLAPGTYTFRYQLRASIAGDFNVLPPRAEMMYFPEVFGRGAGSVFHITRP